MKLIKFSLAICLLLACSCSTQQNIRPLTELDTLQNTENIYKIKRGDILAVNVWGEPKISGEIAVREDGRLTVALIKEVDAQGRTLEDLTAEVTEKLREFVPGASVTITVVHSASIRYYLSGSFANPSEYLSTSKITLLQAIATGGGFAPFADESEITLIRSVDGKESRYILDYNSIIDGTDPNPILKDGDVISVK